MAENSSNVVWHGGGMLAEKTVCLYWILDQTDPQNLVYMAKNILFRRMGVETRQ